MKLTDLIPGVSQAKLILAGIGLALFAVPTVGLLITRHTLAEVKKDKALVVAQRDTEIAKNGVNLASIDTLTKELAAKNAESDARAKAFNDAKAADARTIADLDKRYSSTAARVAALTAISRVGGGEGPCRVPDAVSAALEGL